MKPGDTVEVMNGTYTGPARGNVLTISTSGTASAPITFEAAPGATPVINFSGSWQGIEIDASYITINGLTVVGDAANYNLASATAGYGTGNADLDGNGIAATSGKIIHNIIIENNTVYNEPGGGIGIAMGITCRFSTTTFTTMRIGRPSATAGFRLPGLRSSRTAMPLTPLIE